MEADHSQLNDLFKPLVTSGLSFGATRWLASIVQHFEWSETHKATPFFADGKSMFFLLVLNYKNTFAFIKTILL